MEQRQPVAYRAKTWRVPYGAGTWTVIYAAENGLWHVEQRHGL
jgi:hypothetical protein